MSVFRKIFRPKIGFSPVDPLGDGLRELIHREQQSDGAIDLFEDEATGVVRFWSKIEQDTKNSL